MITLRFDEKSINKINRQVTKKVTALKEMDSEFSKEEIGKAIFTIVSNEFVKDMSLIAKANPDTYKDLYAWSNGVNVGRLFKVTRESVGAGQITIALVPLNSSSNTANSSVSGTPNQNSNIFANPTKSMSGKITFSPKNTLTANPNSNVFSVPNGTATQATNSKSPAVVLYEAALPWFERKTTQIMNRSNFFKVMEKEVSIALMKENSIEAVKQAIRKVALTYSQDKSVI